MGNVPWNKGKKGIHLSPKTEFKKGHKQPPFSEEHRREIGEAIKNHRVKPEIKRFYSEVMRGKKHSEVTKQKLREARLKQVFPIKDTSIETTLQEELDQRGIDYQIHLPVCGICQPDIVFPKQKVAVFADGDYWHSKSFKNGEAWRKDRRQEKTLRENGWGVLRFWGSEIKADVSGCVDKIESIIRSVII